MKKFTVLFVLLFSVCFAEISAQTIRWEVSGYATLQIRINGIDQFSSTQTSSNGILNVDSGAFVEYIATSTAGNYPLEPISTEDDPWMIENAVINNEYNFLNEEHTYLIESFTMPNEIPWYIRMHA